MKRLLSIALLSIALLATVGTAAAETQAEVLQPLTLMGLEIPSWMHDGPTQSFTGVDEPLLDCQRYSQSYPCNYTYFFISGCCVLRESPGPLTYCPVQICA